MKNLFRNNSGAVSVLVVMTMIVLVTFGLLAMNSALYNNRLSERSMSGMETHYMLDYSGEATVSQIDAALYASEREVLEYFANKGFLEETSGLLPDEIARQVQVGYTLLEASGDRQNYLNDMFYRVYLYNAMLTLLEMQQQDSSVTVLLWNEPGNSLENIMSAPMEQVRLKDTLCVGCTITDGNEESETLLDVLVRVQVPPFEFAVSGPEIVEARRAEGDLTPRFGVVAWREYKQTTQQSEVQYWDGELAAPEQ